jgi:hypothetical protein
MHFGNIFCFSCQFYVWNYLAILCTTQLGGRTVNIFTLSLSESDLWNLLFSWSIISLNSYLLPLQTKNLILRNSCILDSSGDSIFNNFWNVPKTFFHLSSHVLLSWVMTHQLWWHVDVLHYIM